MLFLVGALGASSVVGMNPMQCKLDDITQCRIVERLAVLQVTSGEQDSSEIALSPQSETYSDNTFLALLSDDSSEDFSEKSSEELASSSAVEEVKNEEVKKEVSTHSVGGGCWVHAPVHGLGLSPYRQAHLPIPEIFP